METAILALFGIVLGYTLKRFGSLVATIAKLVFAWLLPVLVAVEVSSMDIREWPMFIWGSAFAIVLFYLGRLRCDKHQSALLATSEGGTMGFVLYNIIGTEPMSRFFLIDMLGNGGILFSFIYFQVGNEYKLKEFMRNPLMLAMFGGIALNMIGWHAKDLRFVAQTAPYLGKVVALFVTTVIGSAIKLHVSHQIIRSGFFWSFWAMRTAGAAVSLAAKWPLALTVLFVLPPSFLLPVIYQEDTARRSYASNFIASGLPISLVLAVILTVIEYAR